MGTLEGYRPKGNTVGARYVYGVAYFSFFFSNSPFLLLAFPPDLHRAQLSQVLRSLLDGFTVTIKYFWGNEYSEAELDQACSVPSPVSMM